MLKEECSSSFLFNLYYFVHNINGGSMKKINILLTSLMLLCPFKVNAYSDYVVVGGENREGVEKYLNEYYKKIKGFIKVN